MKLYSGPYTEPVVWMIVLKRARPHHLVEDIECLERLFAEDEVIEVFNSYKEEVYKPGWFYIIFLSDR